MAKQVMKPRRTARLPQAPRMEPRHKRTLIVVADGSRARFLEPREDLHKLVSSEHERIILVESFVLGLPPRTILERHQDCFEDVPAIYGAKRNLLNRLERSRDLRQLYQDLRAA